MKGCSGVKSKEKMFTDWEGKMKIDLLMHEVIEM